MLPYRRRPPAYATKEFRAQQEELESAEERYSGGGPIQRAMERDLIELRPRFLQLIETLTSAPQQHLSAGDAFKCFKQVFGQAKVALVHTRTLPPRSDRGAYVQLLYAACLSLLKQAFEADNVDLQHAIYSVFCLYALYETNPLLPEPQSPLQMLTVGLQHPDNPKFLYRRSFKSPIRIDRYHHSLFQRLYDEALARQSDCQCTRMKAWQSRGANDEDESIEWKCSCGAFMDIVQVIDRLMPNLGLSETTGPSGLDALVGHADYPWGCERPKKPNRNKTAAINVSQQNDARLSNEELDAIAKAEEVFDPLESNLDENMQQYRSNLKQVRLASLNMSRSNQAARVNNALKPIFDQSTEKTEYDDGVSVADEEGSEQPLSALDDDTTNMFPQPVAPAVQREAVLAPLRKESNSAGSIVVERKNALKDLNCQLVLPPDLSETLRNGIEAALNTAIENGDVKIERKTNFLGDSRGDSVSSDASQRGLLDDQDDQFRERETNTRSGTFGTSFLATGTYKEAGDIIEECDSSDLLSIESEDSTTVGRMTLHALLTAAGEDDTLQPTRRKHKRMRRVRQSSSDTTPSQRQPSEPQAGKARSRHAVPLREDLLSSSSDDEGLAFEENVGRASLQALFSAVHNKDDGEPVRRQQEQTLSSRTMSQPKSKPRARKKSSEESDSDNDNNLGLVSLHALLSAIDNNDGQNKRPHKLHKKRKTVTSGRPGYMGEKRPRKLAIQSSDPPSVSSEESVETINVGRTSLETLLAAVNVEKGGQNTHITKGTDWKCQALPSVKRTLIGKQPMKQPSQLQSGEDFLSRSSNDRGAESSMTSEDHNSEHVESSDDDSLQSIQRGQAALVALLSLASKGNNAR